MLQATTSRSLLESRRDWGKATGMAVAWVETRLSRIGHDDAKRIILTSGIVNLFAATELLRHPLARIDLTSAAEDAGQSKWRPCERRGLSGDTALRSTLSNFAPDVCFRASHGLTSNQSLTLGVMFSPVKKLTDLDQNPAPPIARIPYRLRIIRKISILYQTGTAAKPIGSDVHLSLC